VFTVAPGPSPNASTELWTNIGHLLAYTNHHQPITDQSAWPARMFDHALTAISRREPGAFVNWAPWAASAMLSLASLVNSGRWYLRRCRRCALWMLVKDQRHRTCHPCQRAAARERVAKARRREREQQRRARVTVKGT
jgi:hypothetical protein